MNSYYTHTNFPVTNSKGLSAPMRSEFDAVMAAFDLLPSPKGVGQKGFSGGSWSGASFTDSTLDNTVIGGVLPAAGSFTALGGTVLTLTNGGTIGGTLAAAAGAALTGFAISGGTLDGPVGSIAPNTASFTSLSVSGATTLTGSLTTKGGIIAQSGVIELGNQAGGAGNAIFDYHSSGGNLDYDARIWVTGGGPAIGQGTMSFYAGAYVFDKRPTFAGSVPWDHANLPSPVQTTGATFTGQVIMNAQTFRLGLGSSMYLESTGASYGAYLRADASGLIGFINNAGSAWNMQISDNGAVNFPRQRPTWFGGLTPWDNGNLTALSQLTNNVGFITASAQVASAVRLYNTGNAAGQLFNWSGQAGQPTWVWGANDANNAYVWNPSNFSVNYANGANYANSAGAVNGVGSPASKNAVCVMLGIGAEIGPINPTSTAALDAPGPSWIVGGIRVGSWHGPSSDCVGSLYLRLTQVQQV